MALGLAGLAVLWPPSARSGDLGCPTTGSQTVDIPSVEPRLELRLADGRVLRLVGLDPTGRTPQNPDGGETSRSRLAALVKGQALTMLPLAAAPDRWGRIPAFVFMAGGGAGGLAAAAIASGVGRYRSEPLARVCRQTLLAAESKAREATLGLWADPYYGVLAVDDRVDFIERAGTNVLAQGRLVAVQPGPFRTTLRFSPPDKREGKERGSHGGRMLVATILPRTMKDFVSRGVDVKALIGRTIRFRGLLDLRFGPQIELADPDDMEVVAPNADTPVPGSN